jgi:hypothetical protein
MCEKLGEETSAKIVLELQDNLSRESTGLKVGRLLEISGCKSEFPYSATMNCCNS